MLNSRSRDSATGKYLLRQFDFAVEDAERWGMQVPLPAPATQNGPLKRSLKNPSALAAAMPPVSLSRLNRTITRSSGGKPASRAQGKTRV